MITFCSQRTVLTQQFVDFLLDNGLRLAYILPTFVHVLAGLMSECTCTHQSTIWTTRHSHSNALHTVVGAVIALLMSVLACCLCMRRRRGPLKKEPPSIALTTPVSVLQPPSVSDHTHQSTGPTYEREEHASATNIDFEGSLETSQELSNSYSTFKQ